MRRRASAGSMLLQALFVMSAGFSHTALRLPCASAACQQLKLRSCASADANKSRLGGRRLGGRAVNKLAAKTPAKEIPAEEVKGAAWAKQVGEEGGGEGKTLSRRLGIDAGMLRAFQDFSNTIVNSLESAPQKLKPTTVAAAKEGAQEGANELRGTALLIAGAFVFTASVLFLRPPTSVFGSLLVGCLGVAFMARGIYEGR